MFNKVKGAVLAKAAPAVLAGRRHSPEVAVGLGILAMGTAAVLLARAHKRADHIHMNLGIEKDELEMRLAEAEEQFGVKLTEKQVLTASTPIYGRYVLNLVKAYGPSVLLAGCGVGLILGAHRIQAKRIQGLGAALVLVQQGFDTYRQRVRDAYGDTVDSQMLWGHSMQTITKIDEHGKKKKVKVAKISPEMSPEMYNREFDYLNRMWRDDPEVNAMTLQSEQGVFNDILHIRGWVSLNMVYARLGFEYTEYGQVVGWAKGMGDNYISFGLDSEVNKGRAPGDPYWLEFNVSGNILDKIK